MRSPGQMLRSAASAGWGAAVALGDLTPPGVRYGYVHPFAARLLAGNLPTLGQIEGLGFGSADESPSRSSREGPTCVLAADSLDVGGVGRVVEMLAVGLPAAGFRTVVLTPVDGQRGSRLRRMGVDVVVTPDRGATENALRELAPDVIELHSAPRMMVDAAMAASSAPLVPVLHNTEIHYDREQWGRTESLFQRSARVIAVSAVVREFHLNRLPATPPKRVVVVPNGTFPLVGWSTARRHVARARLERVLRTELKERLVFTCLARYDSQKNLSGLVSGFLRATERDGLPDALLVVAGDPSDWLEVRRAGSVARAHTSGDRVHLLGRCDAAALLTASDGFVLDSFFEGWPVATTEALAAGLPIVVSDTGGARELVARARPGSALIANPAGLAASVSDATVRRARRRARHQPNTDQLGKALRDMARSLRLDPVGEPPLEAGFEDMIGGHVAVLTQVGGR